MALLVVVVPPRFKTPDSTIRTVIGRDPVFCHSRKVAMSAEELTLILAGYPVRLSKPPLPSLGVHAALVVLHEAIVVVHQLCGIV